MGQKRKGTEGLIEVENPNLAKVKSVKAKDVDVSCIDRFLLECIIWLSTILFELLIYVADGKEN